jgi:hypothetical protein
MRLPRERGAKTIRSIVSILSLLSVLVATGLGRLPVNPAGAAVVNTQPADTAKASEKLNPDAVRATYGRLPMQFEASLKQSRAYGSQFVSREAGYTLMFSSNEVLMSLNAAEESDLGLAGTQLRTSSLLGPTSRQSRIRTPASRAPAHETGGW